MKFWTLSPLIFFKSNYNLELSNFMIIYMLLLIQGLKLAINISKKISNAKLKLSNKQLPNEVKIYKSFIVKKSQN